MTRPDREQRVSQAFVALADTLVDDYDVIDMLDLLVTRCVELLDADAVGILLGDARRELRLVASSSEDAQTTEMVQLQSGEGPCLDCYSNLAPVSVPDLDDARGRWPTFIAAATRAGTYRSIHAVPLRLRGEAIGAMNLFHRVPGPLPDADIALAQALADVATIGILQERSIRRGEVVSEQLQSALNSRVIVEQAKGVLAQHFGEDMQAAFERLRGYARPRSLRMGELARQIAAGECNLAALGSPDRVLPRA